MPARSRSLRPWAARSAVRCSSYVRARRAAPAVPWSPRRRRGGRRSARRPGRGPPRPAGRRGPRGWQGRCARPPRRATNRPVAQISSARAYPTRLTRGWVPVRSGTRPRLVSRMANCTSSATIRRSQARASWKPAPMAWPWTVAIDTRSLRRHQVNASWYSAMVASSSASGPRAMSRKDGSPSNPSGVNACRSRPAEKDLPSPRSTTTRTSPGSTRPASVNARHRAGDWALRLAGLVSVTVATASSTVSRTPSLSSTGSSEVMGRLRIGCSQHSETK
ncbi:hypothetical protein SMICM304S_10019 [Streptomyces microflavus]